MIAGVRIDEDGNEIAARAKPVPRIAVAVTAQPASVETRPEVEPVGVATALSVGAAKRGRPRVVEDRQKYKAEKNRQYRAAKKGEVDAKGSRNKT